MVKISRLQSSAIAIGFILSCSYCQVSASQFNNDDYTNDDQGIFEASRKSLWLYSSSAMAIEYHGCTWAYSDNTDDAGCLGASSEDGLSSWYLMSNCRRTQAVYSVYSTEESTSVSCSKGTYQGTVSNFPNFYIFLFYCNCFYLIGCFSSFPKLACTVFLVILLGMMKTHC